MTPTRTSSPVLIVGTGLLGTSIGLGLRALGVDVLLRDVSPAAQHLASDYGAGRIATADSARTASDGDRPRVVVVCVPPDVTGEVVAEQLAAWPDAIVTDVASVKVRPLEELRERGAELGHYVGSHPMAGREIGGALSGRGDLFIGRPWVIATHEAMSADALRLVESIALDLGAVVVTKPVEEHDAAVALISHVPQLVSSAVAAQLIDDDIEAAALAGGGLRDVTRIAASDPKLWLQILSANGPRVARILRSISEQLTATAEALDDVDAPGARRTIAELMNAGNVGVTRIPGKHGGRRVFTSLTVMIDDTPGQLARLFNDIGAAEINVEELLLEHSPGANIGLIELSVVPEVRDRLVHALEQRGWKVAA